MIGIEHLPAGLGPVVIFLGAAFEGQSAVIAGGFLAHQGLMSLWVCLACAFAGSCLIDQGLFIAGRLFRDNRFVVRAAQTPAFAKALGFIERYPIGFILVFRFLYGLRLVSPIAIGVSRVSALRFAILNAVAALLWAGAFVALGYVFGETIEAAFGRFKSMGHSLLVAAGIALIAFILFHLVKRLRRRASPAQTPVDAPIVLPADVPADPPV